MRLLELSLACPAADLALDEALLEAAEAAPGAGADGEVLRLWEFDRPVVVLGRGSKAAAEVDLRFCREAGIPVFRRCSGGATVVGGPGCLMYSLVLSMQSRPALRKLDLAHQHVMGQLQQALHGVLAGVARHGTCDLAYGSQPRKFSGNSLRLSRDHLLYHGTVLYDGDLALIARCLRTAPRQPAYRQQRDHADFLVNLPLPAEVIRRQLIAQFATTEPLLAWPRDRVASLRQARYDCEAWNFRH
jgi:lipoate-protein ligase A